MRLAEGRLALIKLHSFRVDTRRSATGRRLGAILIALSIASFSVPARSQVATERTAAPRRAFEDDRFGLFIHWGVYSVVGKGEWVMERDQLPIAEYAKLPGYFNPTRFDAAAWVKLAKDSGAKYITVTAKHHDGFCMFASRLTDFDIVDSTPFRNDPLKALADACREQKIKLFFYYSLLDWHHPDYFPLGKTGRTAGRENKGEWSKYVAYYQGQIRELCTNYGELGGLWFDGWWDKPEALWDLAGTYRLIHELQPRALVGNNHHVAPFPGEDFQIFEQDLPGKNAAGFNKVKVSGNLPLETCMTINGSWGFDARDTKYKSAESLIQALVESAGRGANLLLNVGPRPDGTIDLESSQRLAEMGAWLKTYGDSVYGTRRGPIPPQPWGVSTEKGERGSQRIYLHILKLKPGEPIVFDPTVAWTPFLFGKTDPLGLTRRRGVLELDLPQKALAPFDTIVVLRPDSSAKGR
jgi:alpha-L-fucosidase